jgi:predicted MFS family arabinose efflux permease
MTDSKPALVSRPLLAVFAVSFAAMMSFYVLLSVVPQFASSVGATGIAAGLATGALMLSTVLAEFATPAFASKVGCRLAITLGLLLLGLPALAMRSAKTVGWILALCLARGVGVAILVVLGGSLVASLVPAERRGEGLGMYAFIVGVPAVVGLPLGLWLAQHRGYPFAFLIGGAVALTGLVVAPALPRQGLDQAHGAGIVSLVRASRLARPSILFAVTTMAAGAVVTFLPLSLPRATGAFAALALLVQAASSTIARWWAGHAGDRHGSAKLLVPAVVVAALGVLGLVFASSTVAVVIGMILFGCGFGIAQNASLAVMFDRVASDHFDTVSALWNLAYDGGLGIGAAGFGVVASQTAYTHAFGFLAALMLVPTILVGSPR